MAPTGDSYARSGASLAERAGIARSDARGGRQARAAMGGKDALIGYVGRIPAPVRTKLLAAFLLIELLLVALGAIGLLALREVEQRSADLASLQHKIDSYRQMQHDTLRQLYGVSAALAAPDNSTVERAAPNQSVRLRP